MRPCEPTSTANCKCLANVNIGEGVTNIGSSAFSRTAIKSVTIPDSVTRIDSYAFSDCKALNSASIPSGGISVHKKAFEGCEKLSGGIQKRKVTKKKEEAQTDFGKETPVSGDIAAKPSKKERNQGIARPSGKAGFLLTLLSVILLVVASVFLFTARVVVMYEFNNDGSYNTITNNYVEAIFNGMNISPLCALAVIGVVITLAALLVKMADEIKRRACDRKSIILDIVTIVVSAVPIVFSAVTMDAFLNLGLPTISVVMSSVSTVLTCIHLILSLAKNK